MSALSLFFHFLTVDIMSTSRNNTSDLVHLPVPLLYLNTAVLVPQLFTYAISNRHNNVLYLTSASYPINMGP